jgi:molybdenum cofactor cytidylyltransferase
MTVSLVVLAAGFSTRFGAEDKLLATIHSNPVLTETLRVFSGLNVHQRILVINAGGENHAAIGRQNEFDIAVNDDAASGMGTSIAAGVQHLQAADGVMIALGDMPFLSPDTATLLLQVFNDSDRTKIIAPGFSGRRGHPVIFPALCFDALSTLTGDNGARSVISSNPDLLRQVDVNDAGVLGDIDTPADLKAAEGKRSDAP